MRFLSPEGHANFLRNLVEERKLRNRIQDLQICHAAGCRTIFKANAYLEQKRKKKLEESMLKSKEAGASLKPHIQHKAINRPNMMKVGGLSLRWGAPGARFSMQRREAVQSLMWAPQVLPGQDGKIGT